MRLWIIQHALSYDVILPKAILITYIECVCFCRPTNAKSQLIGVRYIFIYQFCWDEYSYNISLAILHSMCDSNEMAWDTAYSYHMCQRRLRWWKRWHCVCVYSSVRLWLFFFPCSSMDYSSGRLQHCRGFDLTPRYEWYRFSCSLIFEDIR